MAIPAYTARFQLPDLIEQGRDNALRCPVYLSGGLAVPTAGIASIYDATGAAVTSAATATIAGSVAGYTVASATLATRTRGEGWRVEWALTMPDGVVHTFRNEAALVRRALYPVVTDADLFRRVSSLDPAGPSPITRASTQQDKIDEAWVQIQQKLLDKGNRPNLIMSPSALRSVHLAAALALVFEDLASRVNASYETRAKAYRDEARAAWAELRFLYDEGDDGQADTLSRRPSGRTVWTNGRGPS